MPRWTEQNLRTTVTEVVAALREDARNGRLVLTEWDHNSPGYRPGRSNKQLKIAAAIVLGREPDDYHHAREVMLELAFGPRVDTD